jgi:hypothetical protein
MEIVSSQNSKRSGAGMYSQLFYDSYFLLRDKTHVEWVKGFTSIFDEMKKYVMEYHATGLVWNAKARKFIGTFHENISPNASRNRAYPSPSIRPRQQPQLVAHRLPHLRLHPLGHRRRRPVPLLLQQAVVLRPCLQS